MVETLFFVSGKNDILQRFALRLRPPCVDNVVWARLIYALVLFVCKGLYIRVEKTNPRIVRRSDARSASLHSDGFMRSKEV